jgi:uncharacterized membrane protein YGL010W
MSIYGNNITSLDTAFDFHPTVYYNKLSDEFAGFHTDSVNVLFHLVTTPLGLVGTVSLIHAYTKSWSFVVAASCIYLISLLPAVPNGVFIGTSLFCGVITLAAKELRLTLVSSVMLIILGYILQDLAHMGTGEKTFQSSYSAGGDVRCFA